MCSIAELADYIVAFINSCDGVIDTEHETRYRMSTRCCRSSGGNFQFEVSPKDVRAHECSSYEVKALDAACIALLL